MTQLRRVFGLSVLLMTVPTLGFASELGDLAATVAPGTFVELEIDGPVSTCQAMVPPLPLKDAAGNDIPRASSLGNILQFTDEALWDPIGRDIYIMGTRRPYKRWDQGFVKYSVDTNSWTILDLPPFGVGAHGYDNGALDVQRRTYYWSRIGSSRIVWAMNLDTGVWTRLPNAPIQSGQFSAIEFFPELDRLVFFDGLVEYSGGQPTGNGAEYALYNPDTGQWESPVSLTTTAPFGAISHFSEYNPTHNVLYFGGGYHYSGGGTVPDPTPGVDDSRRFYMLDDQQVVTRLADPPLALGQHGSGPVQTIDPNTGKLVVFQGKADSGPSTCTNPLPIWEYDQDTNAWTQTGTQQLTSLYCSMDTVAVPLYEYGVNFIVSVRSQTNCRVYLYRHSAAEAESASALTQENNEVEQILLEMREELALLEEEERQTVGPGKKKSLQREIRRLRKQLVFQEERVNQETTQSN